MRVDTIRIERGDETVDVAITSTTIQADVDRCIVAVGDDEAKRLVSALAEGLSLLDVTLNPAAHEQTR